MKKVIRLKESDLVRIVKRVLLEQVEKSNDWYFKKAKELLDLMSGIDVKIPFVNDTVDGIYTENEGKIIDIFKQINTQEEWDKLKKAFGTPKGEGLVAWINDEFTSNPIELTDMYRRIEKNSLEQYIKVGTKIRLITNRQFIRGRAYTYSEVMDEYEKELDMNDCTVVYSDKDKIKVKCAFVDYYEQVSEKRNTPAIHSKTLRNVCVEIPTKDIVSKESDTLQLTWFSPTVLRHIVTC
jgi:hypothetical protein